jgi:anionic cell wall polymer biosynthesis LytR-Cps2A-Psr (LCP) family protein
MLLTIDFQGFKDLVNALGGVKVVLDQPFEEALQFREPQVCDAYVFTVPTKPAQYQYKYHTRKNGTRYVAKAYPFATTRTLNVGGILSLSVGENILDGERLSVCSFTKNIE